MSIDRCRCGALVDTDADPACYQPDPRYSLKPFPDICVCAACRELDEQEADRASAATP